MVAEKRTMGSPTALTTAAQELKATEAVTPPRISVRWVRIIPVALIMYTIAFIDRTNISLALPHISRDLHLDPEQAGTIAGIFFWGYLALQIPGGHLAKHWSAKKFIGILLVAWAIFAVGCGLARTYHELLLLRLLLGVAESGVYPATLILLSHWFSRSERARANALWLLCLPGAVILSSPFSGWMLDHWNWRVMLVAEGSLPFLWLAIWLAFIQDHPKDVAWLPEQERGRLVEALRRESCELEGSKKVPFLRALLRPQVFLLAAVYFCFVSGQMGLLFWLPSAMEKFRRLSSLSTGILYTIPFVVGATSLLLISQHSDKVRERRLHAAGAMLFGGSCILLAVVIIPHSLLIAFIFIGLSGVGAYGPMGAFWAIPTETLSPKIVGSVMGFVNAIGNLGAYFAPLVVGYLNKRTGTFLAGFTYLGLITLVAAGLATFMRTTPSSPETSVLEHTS
jgi:sugar phosphate permease